MATISIVLLLDFTATIDADLLFNTYHEKGMQQTEWTERTCNYDMILTLYSP